MKSNNSPHRKQHKDNKKHNTASTSKASFKALNATGQRQIEKQKVLAALVIHQPSTSRMLSKLLNIERTNITRTLNDLLNEDKKIKVAYERPCKTTGKTVNHYSIIEYLQTSLFKKP